MTSFPHLDAVALDGQRWRLPDDLEGTSVVVLAFERHQQAEVDDWIAGFIELGCEFPIFEVPTIRARYRLMRGFIDGGMRSGIADPAVRARTLTTYTDVSRVLGSLGVSSADHVVVTLVDATGKVRALSHGAFDPTEAARLLG